MFDPKDIFGGGAQGGTLGILEFLSQNNDSADMVPEDSRFKFIDDLSLLEILDLLSQPNKKHNPNNKTIKTVVGLKLSNRWEPPTHPPPTHHHHHHKLKTTW